jgi:hypothetical protein
MLWNGGRVTLWDPETDAVYLPKTGLSLERDHLIKVSSKGEVIGRFSLGELRDIQAISTIDSFGLAIALGTFIAAASPSRNRRFCWSFRKAKCVTTCSICWRKPGAL